ncbi:MAG: ABC transporter permease [Thermomicrobiales bacterium]
MSAGTFAAGSGGLRQAITDGWLVAWRNLKRVPRIPEMAIFMIMQSIMFVLLFAFVFGGAIPLPGGGSYREFLLPGIYAQTIVFASSITAVGMVDDVSKGIIDRFRSLPMARSAVLSGRAMFDLVYQLGILVVLMVSGYAVDWRWHEGFWNLLAGIGILLLFVFAMSWVGIYIGLSLRTVESAQQVGFMVIFPLTFVSNAFVPMSTLPSWLRPVAEWNPVSTLTSSIRELWGNPNPYATDNFPSEHPIVMTLIWVVIIIAVFAPLGVRKYRNISR